MTAPAAPVVGYKAKMGVAVETTPGTAVTPTVGIEFISETLTGKYSHVQDDGIRGHRGRDSEDVVQGPIDVSGTITLPFKTTIMQTFLPWILGGATDGSSHITPLADTLAYFTVMIDRGAKVFTYSGCKIDKATVRSQKGQQPMTIELEIVAMKVSVGNSGSFTGGLSIALEQPYMHYQGVFTFNSVARHVDGATVVIDNKLDRDQYRNSQTRQVIPETDRTVTVEVDTPWTADEVDLLTLELAAGVGGSIVYANGPGDAFTWTFVCLQVPQSDPSVASRGAPIPLKTMFTARGVTTTGTRADEVTATLVPAA